MVVQTLWDWELDTLQSQQSQCFQIVEIDILLV